jgi:hypothetical protein
MWFTAVLYCNLVCRLAADSPRWGGGQRRLAAKRKGRFRLRRQEITHLDIIATFNKEFPFIKVLTTSDAAAIWSRALSRNGA